MVVTHSRFICDPFCKRDFRLESSSPHGSGFLECFGQTWHACNLVFDYCGSSKYPAHSHVSFALTQGQKYVTGAAQVVDASRVVFAFARDNALPGSRYWKRMNRYTQTPVNAVWFVVVVSSICGVLSFSPTALTSLAG
jgi:hypothetical protein